MHDLDRTGDRTDPIPLIKRDDPAAHSGDVVAENVAALKALFPSIVTDGKVDLDVLRQLLGAEVDEGEERYGLNWKGKKRARAFALTPSLGTLRPAKEDSVKWDTTKNIVIEGDNLEVLKLLRRSYAGRVKLIYIDPPYNTGTDRVYRDDYQNSLGTYERLMGERSSDGIQLVSNPKSSGRFHTDWLNMMYPRLLLARDLLRDDGLIFISIDASELSNLKEITESVFGSEAYFGLVSRVTGTPTGGGNKALVGEVDYIAIYGRGTDAQLEGVQFSEADASIYDKEDENGKYLTRTLRRTGGEDRREDRPTMDLIEFFQRTENGETVWQVHQKFYLEGRKKQPSDFWSNVDGNKKATREVKSLFDKEKVFDNPKPVGLIRRVLEIGDLADDEIVMDFFAGSGTTGHATMAQNALDGGTRRFILIQLPEQLDPQDRNQKAAADFCDRLGKPRNIAELTKERLRRAGAKVREDHPAATEIDTGFRVYKLATSNLKPWQPDPDNLEASLLDAVDNVLADRTEDDLLVELLLKTGIDLTLPGDRRTIAGKAVHALGGGVLMVCLGDIAQGEAEELGNGICDWRDELDPPRATTFYFKDSGFATAATKANLAAIIRQRLGKAGVEKLASI